MAARKRIIGSFEAEDQALSTIEALRETPWRLERIHSPFPSHRVMKALKTEKSRVGYFTLGGGIIGFFTGFALAIYTAVQWDLIVSGKPVLAFIPFLIVGFEFTILFAVFGNILGLLIQARLPEYETLKTYDARFSGEHFGLVASCGEEEQEALVEYLKSRGAEVQAFEA